MKTGEETLRIIEVLKELYPDALCSLTYEKDYELLFAVRLSAQCTDARVNLVTPENAESLLLLERLSPLLVLIPGLCYGWGYTRGVNERSRVHTSIAAGNRRRARKEAKARKARAASTPKQLN